MDRLFKVCGVTAVTAAAGSEQATQVFSALQVANITVLWTVVQTALYQDRDRGESTGSVT